MGEAWSRRIAWLAAIVGLLLALLMYAPARWLAQALTSASRGQVQLVNPRGTIWTGRADLLLTGGEGSRSETALPQGIHWQLAPRLVSGVPALGIRLTAPCCTPEPLGFTLTPRWGGAELQIDPFNSRWPAELLVGLGTPWNTLRIEGQLALQSQGLTLRWDQGRANIKGGLNIDSLDTASRLSTLRPLGSYRMELRASPDGHTATLNLSTLRGDLQLQGSGQWVGGRLRFQGQAQAAPGSEVALTNLLNIMGKRRGPISVFNIG